MGGVLFALWLFVIDHRGNEFLNYDDNVYVTQNPTVLNGLTLAGIWTALTTVQNAGWNPLATTSHMLDVHLFGMNARMHRATGILLHVVAIAVLYLCLTFAGVPRLASMGAVLILGVHPLVIEPVLWVSSRKDTMCLVFVMFTMLTYGLYAKSRSWSAYVSSLVLFAFALMAKPMAVTLPVLLILVDYWPLKRWDAPDERRQWMLFFLEKTPFFMLSMAVAVITFFAQKSGGAVRSVAEFPLAERILNALVSYVVYVQKFFWPTGLSAYYPHPGGTLTMLQGILALAVLIVITAAAFALRRRAPYLVAGWLWFLIALVPVIGFVQIGSFARADRFVYLPLVGLCVIVACGLPDFTQRAFKRADRAALGIFVPVFVLLVLVSKVQAGHWRDSIRLWERALAVTVDNPIARANLGQAQLERGDIDGAIVNLESAVVMAPDFADPMANLVIAYTELGELDKALAFGERGLEARPGDPDILVNIGNVYRAMGRVEESIEQYKSALLSDPNHISAHLNLATALDDAGQYAEAVPHFESVLATQPGNGRANKALGIIALRSGDADSAIRRLEVARTSILNDVDIEFNLGAAYATTGREAHAVPHFKATLELNPQHPQAEMIRGFLVEFDRPATSSES